MDNDSAELGDEITDDTGIARPLGAVVSTELEPETGRQIVKRADAEGRRVTDLVREVIYTYLSAAQSDQVEVRH